VIFMIQILRLGSSGDDVERWQNFLRGQSPNSSIIVTGNFDSKTELETKSFQSRKGLVPDGIVGPKTLSTALQAGYPLMDDPTASMDGPNWPPRPSENPLSSVEREKVFGKFSHVAAPTQSNPEAITITGDWIKKNISNVNIPQLSGTPGAPKSCNITIHNSISKQFVDLFNEWDNAGLLYLIMSWGGSWSPRFIRGSRTTLSNHAWATAFDINVQWNGLGVQPALRGETGSVRELVEIAYNHGFYWGGWFQKRPDGMHFEAFKIL
jgi:hypothetical protein